MGFYAPHVLLNEAKRRGIRVLRPDLNESEYRNSVTGRRTVRTGLVQIKGVSEEFAQHLLDARRRDGAYRSLADVVCRTTVPRPVVEALIDAGARDGLGLQRRELRWQLGLFMPARAFGAGRVRNRTPGKQLSLALPTAQDHVELPPLIAWQRMADEYRTLGLSPHYHPFQLLRAGLGDQIATSGTLATLPHGMPVKVAGLVVCRQRPGAAKGITFLLLEDETGLVTVIVYPDLYEDQRPVVRAEPMVIVAGRLQRLQGNINVLASHIAPLGAAALAPPVLDVDGDDRRENADPRLLDLKREGALSPVDDLTAITPAAHYYR